MLKKRNLSELAYEEIVDRIIRGIFKAGETLQEEKLSAEFEISRTPVREALKKLSSEGFIEQLSRGFRVAILNRDALKELFECRCALEIQALRNSINLIPETEIDQLLERLELCTSAKNPKKLALKADHDMHDLIRDYCGNRYLSSLIGQFLLKTAPYRSYRNVSGPSIQKLIEERSAILHAIRKRNFQKASLLLRKHIMNGISACGDLKK